MLILSPDGLLFRLVDANNLQILFWRGLFCFFAVALFRQLTRPGGIVGAVRAGGRPGLASVALLTGGSICFVTSITQTAVANTLVILATIPLFAAILGWIFLRARVAPRTWAAIAAAVCGIVIIFAGSLGSVHLLGDLLALGAALCLASNLVLIRAHPRIDVLAGVGLAGLVLAVLMLPIAEPLVVRPRDIAMLASMGVALQSVGFGMFLAAGRYLPPAETALFMLVETVLGPLWVWLGVGEVPGAGALAGGAIVLVTVALHSAAGLRQSRRLPVGP